MRWGLVMNYVFRFIDPEDKPTGYYGFISAYNASDLFWGIDEHGDPYAVELVRIKRSISMCIHIEEEYFNDEQNLDLSECQSELETSETFLEGIIDLFKNKNTKKYPHWKKNEEYEIESVVLKDHRQ